MVAAEVVVEEEEEGRRREGGGDDGDDGDDGRDGEEDGEENKTTTDTKTEVNGLNPSESIRATITATYMSVFWHSDHHTEWYSKLSPGFLSPKNHKLLNTLNTRTISLTCSGSATGANPVTTSLTVTATASGWSLASSVGAVIALPWAPKTHIW